jgi:hypothetical protein
MSILTPRFRFGLIRLATGGVSITVTPGPSTGRGAAIRDLIATQSIGRSSFAASLQALKHQAIEDEVQKLDAERGQQH